MPMLSSSQRAVEDLLVGLELVPLRELQVVQRTLGERSSPERLLRELEAANLLTSYQAGKLLKGDAEGLRLGRYKLLYRNASGSFARVFRACSVDDSRVVGIKLLRQRYASDPRIVSQFRREGELGKKLQHRNIVPIYDVEHDGHQHFITMEFVEGGNFRDFIRIRQKFAPPEATQYALDIARALEYALRFGVTHRDLKLSNVLLSSQGVAKLVDFGLAGQERSLAAIEADVDRAIEYVTLEQGSGAPDGDPRSDLYFLGAIYYELLTGVPPYPPTRSREERRSFSRYRDVRPVRAMAPSLPGPFAEIVTRLMQVRPQDRFQTPAEVVTELERLVAGDHASKIKTPSTAQARTLICVEHRPAQQNALREYFSRHGYRVLMIGDAVRALNRVESESPTGLLLIGDALEPEQIEGIYQAAVRRGRLAGTGVVLVLSAKQSALRNRLVDGPGAAVLADAVTLRKIREFFDALKPSR